MKKLLVSAIAAMALLAGPAMAADLPAKAPVYKAAPIATAYNWTGLYIGVHGGGDWSSNDWFVPSTATNILGGCPIGGCNVGAGGHSASSWLAGGQIGFNYQIAQWVLGVEAQASWTKLEGSNADTAPGFGFITDHTKTDSLGTIAGRVGYAWDRWMLYGKGGGAWAHNKFWTSVTGIPEAQSNTETRWGWMAGIGIEYAVLNNWSVKVEYDYLDLGTKRETLQNVAAGGPFDYDVTQKIQLVKVGVNYRFSGLFGGR